VRTFSRRQQPFPGAPSPPPPLLARAWVPREHPTTCLPTYPDAQHILLRCWTWHAFCTPHPCPAPPPLPLHATTHQFCGGAPTSTLSHTRPPPAAHGAGLNDGRRAGNPRPSATPTGGTVVWDMGRARAAPHGTRGALVRRTNLNNNVYMFRGLCAYTLATKTSRQQLSCLTWQRARYPIMNLRKTSKQDEHNCHLGWFPAVGSILANPQRILPLRRTTCLRLPSGALPLLVHHCVDRVCV